MRRCRTHRAIQAARKKSHTSLLEAALREALDDLDVAGYEPACDTAKMRKILEGK